MTYMVLARKYRPTTFEEVVGQEPVARTLRNAIGSERVAHAYLFTGPRGVGKTSMARIFAMALNCQESDAPTPEPCGKCASCTGIFIGEDVDVREIDGASNNSVEDVRTLRDNAIYHPAHSRFKIYIIDEVHMLSKGAFNALLKTLEEPPAHVKFIFATTEPQKLPETIHSRCQRFDFRNIATADIVKRLKQICRIEKVKAREDVLAGIARRARGGMRDSQSLLDQVIAYGPDEVTAETVAFVLGGTFDEHIDRLLAGFRAKDPAEALGVVHTLITDGHDLTEFLTQLVETLRAVMVLKATGGDAKMVDLPAERIEVLNAVAADLSMDNILYMLQLVSETDRKARTAVEKRVLVESAAVRLATMEDLKPLGEILELLKSGEAPRAETRAPSRPAAAAPVAARPSHRPAKPAERETPPVERAPAERPPVQEEPPGDEEPPEPPAKEHRVTAGGELGEVQKTWPRVIALIKKKGQPSIAAFLKEAEATALDDDALTVTFPPGFEFHRDQLAEDDRLAVVEGALAEVLGRKLRVRLANAGPAGKTKGTAAKTKPTESPRRGKSQSPGVQRAVEMFGGRVVDEDE